MCKGMRVAYVSGPIDAVKVYDEWRNSSKSDYYGTIYLAQLYQILDDLNAKGLVITTLPDAGGPVRRGDMTIVNLPLPEGPRGIFFHLAMMFWALRCLIAIARFRADAAVLTAGQDYFWVFRPLQWLGTELIASLHCTLWPRYAPRKWHQLFLTRLNGLFFYPACHHTQGVSEEAVRQISETAARLRKQPVRFLATYRAERFADVKMPSWPTEELQFRLLYVGRLTRNKGVFDMVQILALLEKRHPGRFALDVCGEGPVQDQLMLEVRKHNLENVISVHGQTNAAELQVLYGRCHAVLIPTRSDFEEGTPKVAFEAVLNFRPVIMSAACPALADVAEATVEAMVDDIADYAAAIERIASQPALYRAKVSGAAACRPKHFDESNSYGAKLFPAIAAVSRRSRAGT